ncbi:hypothetical protein [Deinococcus sp. LM3]|uniref:hypothetical protein n=1 Tax=Deinococcus sp. LM3 TaxID=1938608 RepID=UPI00117F0379|nr:hypothetical protein [Deinococcus sp. LM3]
MERPSFYKILSDSLSFLCILILAFGFGSSQLIGGIDNNYILFIAMMPFYLVSSVGLARSWRKISSSAVIAIVISLTMVFLWAYSVMMGIINGNNLFFIIQNNAGVIGYLILIPLIFAKTDMKIVSILRLSGIIVMLTTILLKLLSSFAGWDVTSNLSQTIFGPFVGDGGVRWGRIFTYAQYLVCVPVMYYLVEIFTSKDVNYFRRVVQILTIFLGLYVIFSISMSKGMQLAIIFSALLTFLAYLRSSRFGWKLAILAILFSSACLSVYLSAFPSNIISENFFSEEDISNVARYEQLRYIIDDIKLFGNGSGATILNYSRAEGQDYGFELSYIALFHKFGILGVIPIILYVVTILSIIHLCDTTSKLSNSAALISAMSFLMPAIGNPGLFSLQETITHSMVITAVFKYRSLSLIAVD